MTIERMAQDLRESDDAYHKLYHRALVGENRDYTGIAQAIFLRNSEMDAYQFEAWLKEQPEYGSANPVHQPHPSADRWFPITTDLCGIRVPSIKLFGTTDVCFLPIYGAYPPEVRADIRAALHARHYTHIVLDPLPKYPPFYPSAVLGVDVYRALLQEVVDDGLIPITFWLPDNLTAAQGEDAMSAYVSDEGIRSLSKLNSIGWEINGWMSPVEMEQAARWLRASLPPDALVFIHFTPGHAAGSGEGETEQHWWARLAAENVLDGIFLQLEPSASVEEQADRIKDFTVRLTGGLNQWPMRQGDGSPLRVVVFEYDAYPQSRERMTEAEGIARRKVFEVIPGVSGVANQP